MRLSTDFLANEPAILVGPADAPCSECAKPMVLAATILALSMVFIDGTVANVVLPALK